MMLTMFKAEKIVEGGKYPSPCAGWQAMHFPGERGVPHDDVSATLETFAITTFFAVANGMRSFLFAR